MQSKLPIYQMGVVFCVLLLITFPIQAQEKHALIIGNADYENIAKLQNPINDAKAITQTLRLRQLGFRVTELHNRSLYQMENAIRDFGSRLPIGSVALVYFSGHGVQYGGENYLLPVDFLAQFEDQLPRRAVSTGYIMSKLAKNTNGLNIVVLDACRDNPLQSEFRSVSRGLARIDATPPNTFTIFATAPGRVASDNPYEKNGLFTKYFIKNMKRPGLDLDGMMIETRREVMVTSNGAQVPYDTGSLTQRFCFAGCLPVGEASQAPEKTAESLFELAQNEKNLARAMALYKQAALKGHKGAFGYVDALYALPHKRFVKARSEDLFSTYLPITPNDFIGNPELYGEDVHEILYNEREAIQWYKRAAQSGYTTANAVLAMIYSVGSPAVRQSPSVIFHLAQKASNGNSMLGTGMLVLFYHKGVGVAASREKVKAVLAKGKATYGSLPNLVPNDHIMNWWYLENALTSQEQQDIEALINSIPD